MEALEQRLAKYNDIFVQANAEGNSSRARRMERICQNYEEAIEATKAKRPFEYDELPVPPGFPPLPSTAPTPGTPKMAPKLHMSMLPVLAARAGTGKRAVAAKAALPEKFMRGGGGVLSVSFKLREIRAFPTFF